MAEKCHVTLVIPGRNCEATLAKCLQSVTPLLQSGELREIILVDDGSTDQTAEIAKEYPVTILTGEGRGPGAARNLGWQKAKADLIWFIDSDCVAEPNALEILLAHFIENDLGQNRSSLAGVGGSYKNLYPNSLLATLIQEEIIARHRRMPRRVNFLATFNVLYHREVLQQTGGFDESLKLAQDAELAFRICERGHDLQFDIRSRVGHHHPTKLWRYLKTQARQGYYRMALYRLHPSKMKGDSYAGLLDYVQPPLAMLALASLPLLPIGLCLWANAWIAAVPLLCIGALLLAQIPMAFRMLGNPSPKLRSLAFPLMSTIRAIARGIGMSVGTLAGNRECTPQASQDPNASSREEVASLTAISWRRDAGVQQNEFGL